MTILRLSMVAILMATNFCHVQAEPRIDYDLDDDGLIEINDLQDLNEIRNNFDDWNELKGESLYGVSDGCPLDGCSGYELSTDLNFDTNGSGTLDAEDTYWNGGLGWLPIGAGSYKFASEFNGNGHTLHNLVIRRPSIGFVGLFSYSELAYFHDFKLRADITASDNSGGIVGHSWQTRFENLGLDVVFVVDNGGIDCEVNICASEQVGGVVGSSDECHFENIIVKAQITGNTMPGVYGELGGLAGTMASGEVNEVSIYGEITGSERVGALVGYASASQINSVAITAEINGSKSVGGVLGRAVNTSIDNVLVSGSLNAGIGMPRWGTGGGVIGTADSGVTVSRVISLMNLQEDSEEAHDIGALFGNDGISSINHLHWAMDLALRDYLYGGKPNTDPKQTFSLVEIQCATDTHGCNGLQFSNFSEQINSLQQPLWDFGSNEEAPVMVLASGTFGDRDGNGEADDWPQIPSPDIEVSSSDSSPGIGGVPYLIFLLMPWLLRRR